MHVFISTLGMWSLLQVVYRASGVYVHGGALVQGTRNMSIDNDLQRVRSRCGATM